MCCACASLVLVSREESSRLQHGLVYTFPISLDKDLGRVAIAHLYWQYDHDVDPFDLGKICLLFCSDRLYTAKLVISALGYTDRR